MNGYHGYIYQQVVKKMGKAFSYADRIGAGKVALLAPDEWAKGEVVVKDLRTTAEDKKQKTVPFEKMGEVYKYFA